MKLARATVEAIVIPRPEPTPEQPQNLCLDKGYDDDEVRELAEAFGYTAHSQHALRKHRPLSGKRASKRGAGGWSAPRGMNRFRRILTRWEKRASSYLAMLHLACGLITWRATGLLK
jgi:putative transposase